MYTIVMKKDKSLSTTVKETLYQRERLANRIQFLVPPTYENNDLASCVAVFKYKDAEKNVQFDFLVRDEELYENEMLRYVLPVDSKLNRLPSTIVGRLSFIKTDEEGESQFVLHTGETKIQILPVDDYFISASNNAGDMETLDRLIAEKLQEWLAQNPPSPPADPEEPENPDENPDISGDENPDEQLPDENEQIPEEP